MPILKDFRKTIKTSLPLLKDSEVEIYTSLLGGDLEQVAEAKTSDFGRALILLSRIIKDWNLTDEAGNKLPITVENIKKLDIEDLYFLIDKTELGKLTGGRREK